MPQGEKVPRHPGPVPGSSSREISIPPEILGKIYLENALPRYPKHRGSHYPPMAVSKSWRNAALSLPRLWTRVNVTAYSDLSKSSPDSLRTWLSRSKPCLLKVMLHLERDAESVRGRRGRKEAILFETIIKVLFAQAHRLGTLVILADEWQYSHLFQLLNRANQLHDLTLRDCLYPEKNRRLDTVYQAWGISNIPHMLLQSLSRLSISLENTAISAFPTFELPNLTELGLKWVMMELDTLARMIKNMPKLALLKLGKMTGLLGGMPDDLPGEFSELRTLVVSNPFIDYAFLPLLAEHCPNLNYVALHHRSWRDLPRSPLESLTEISLILDDEDLDDEDRLSCPRARKAIKFCPNAKKLTLTWLPETPDTALSFDPFIEVLTSRVLGNGGLLLKLEHLILRNAVLSMSCLLEMVQVRSSAAFQTLRSDKTFYLTLEGCFGLPDITSGSCTGVKELFADPPEINMTFGSCEDPYSLLLTELPELSCTYPD